MTAAIAVLVFLFVVVLVLGGWWVSQVNRNLRSRLSRTVAVGSTQVLRPDIEKGDGSIERLLARTGLSDRLASVATQAGYKAAVSDPFYDQMVIGLDRLLNVGAVVSTPVIDGDVVFFGSFDGQLYALS